MVGAVERVRPKMMTVVAITAGLLPILWSTGTGSEVMQRIAVPMIGGMVSSTILTLVVIPAIDVLIKEAACGGNRPRREVGPLRRLKRTRRCRDESSGKAPWQHPFYLQPFFSNQRRKYGRCCSRHCFGPARQDYSWA